jgi:TolB-like protein
MNRSLLLRIFTFIIFLHFLLPARETVSGAETAALPGAGENLELEKAKRHFRSAEFDKAVAILEQLVAASTLSQPDRIDALEYLAYCYVAKRKHDRVKAIFADLLQIRPDYQPHEEFISDPGLMRCYLESRKKVVGNLWDAGQEPGIKTIAVLDFDNNSIDDAERLANLGKGLADMLITDLAALSKIKVVERERIQYVLSEIALSDSTFRGKRLVDPEYAVRVGKLMGAQSVLIGSFMKLGKKLRVDVRLVKTETSEIFKTELVDGGQDEIFDLARQLAVKVAQNLDVTIGKVEKEKLERFERNGVPLEAWMAYAEALNLLDQERYAEARKFFERALTIAPDFQLAQKKMKVLLTFARG